jgi:hypothetical protein
MKKIMKLNLIEQLAYRSYRKVLTGYAKVFSSGLFHLETRHNKFEQDAHAVSDVFVRSIIALDTRLKALESKGGQ